MQAKEAKIRGQAKETNAEYLARIAALEQERKETAWALEQAATDAGAEAVALGQKAEGVEKAVGML